MSIGGESEKNAQAQVNSGRSKKLTPNQQQESTEVISSASYFFFAQALQLLTIPFCSSVSKQNFTTF